MSITKETILKAASVLADQEGLDHITLKAIAEKLQIRTPSLYNHIKSLDELLREVAHTGMKQMNERMTSAAIGTSGDIAIQSVSMEYFDYIIEHPGIYEVIQWANWHRNGETEALMKDYASLLHKLLLSCSLNESNLDEATVLLMSLLHGYSTMQVGNALLHPEEERARFMSCIATMLCGIHTRYNK